MSEPTETNAAQANAMTDEEIDARFLLLVNLGSRAGTGCHPLQLYWMKTTTAHSSGLIPVLRPPFLVPGVLHPHILRNPATRRRTAQNPTGTRTCPRRVLIQAVVCCRGTWRTGQRAVG